MDSTSFRVLPPILFLVYSGKKYVQPHGLSGEKPNFRESCLCFVQTLKDDNFSLSFLSRRIDLSRNSLQAKVYMNHAG